LKVIFKKETMADLHKIIKAIDEFLEKKHQKTTTPVEINPYLESKGLLNDSQSRHGKPIREILRKGKIEHAYQIGVNWFIPHSKNSSESVKQFVKIKFEKMDSSKPNKTEGHKLTTIGELLVELIEEKHNKKPNYHLEYKPDWLLSFPTESLIEYHPILIKLYSNLVNNEFGLKEKLKELTHKNYEQKQSFDIWIGEPYNFAIEFDEKQHFNQFREITLNFYDKIKINFPIEYRPKGQYLGFGILN